MMGELVVVGLIALVAGLAVGWLISQRSAGTAAARAAGLASEVAGLQEQVGRRDRELLVLREQAQKDAVRAAGAEAGKAAADGALSQLQVALKEALSKADVATQQRNGAMVELSGTMQERDGLKQQLARQETWVAEQTQALRAFFGETASKILEERSTTFGAQNKEQISLLLQPFSEQMLQFRQRLDEVHTENSQARGKLDQQIETLARQASTVGDKADALAAAMLGNSKTIGDWGESQLIVLLEQAGFVEGKHFQKQFGMTGDDNERLIPDIVMNLPSNEKMIVDSKMSLVPWVEYCNATDEEQRKTAMAALVASMTTHYKSLAKKDYAGVIGRGAAAPPFCLMYCAVEGAALEAFKAAPHLFADAQRNRVVIITPTTLFCVVQLVFGLWKIHDKSQNARLIAEDGRKMLEKFAGFVEALDSVGKELDGAVGAYKTARDRLISGAKGKTLMDIAQRLVERGVDAPNGKAFTALLRESGAEPQLMLNDGGGETAESEAGADTP